MNTFDDLTKISLEDLFYYLNIFEEQNKRKFAERIKKEIIRRKQWVEKN